ncbi:MAG: hypothetical protein HUU32_13015 [Calditrichaceae bacterium]|nr:hypothetical protein [Calditrichia bacterium]NUQ42309.1 hypothetical protein [Calditrichaceae bacterium]
MSRFLSLAPAVAIAIAGLVLPQSGLAQSYWVNRSQPKTISLEILKPDFAGDANTTFTTSVIFLGIQFPVAKKTLIVAELPFAHFGLNEEGYDGQSESAIGNPYLGLEFGAKNSGVSGEIGVRAPLTSNEKISAVLTGFFTDFDRLEAFVPDILSLAGMVNYKYKSAGGAFARLRGGPVFWIPTGDSEADNELWLAYGFQAGYESQQVGFSIGFTGRLLATEEDLELGERTFHQLGLAADFGLGNVRPGVHLRLPLDEDLSDVIDMVFGVNLAIQLQ